MATDVRERLLADSQFGGGALTTANSVVVAPATWYLGLSTTIPNGDGSNFTEPVGLNYSRVACVNNITNFPNATTVGGVTTKANGTLFTFPVPSGFWGQALYWGFFIVATGDVPHYTNPLDNPITIQSGNTPVQFAIGQLVLPFG
jgi:hypothetical protein